MLRPLSQLHSKTWDCLCSDNIIATVVDPLLCIPQVGVGRFQWVALAICGLANAADAVEILGLSLVIPAAEDDLHLTASGKSVLSSSIFLGMLLGGLIWGPLGDALGESSSDRRQSRLVFAM